MSNSAAGHRGPASLALRIVVLVGLASTLVFLAFSWVVERSLERHFAEMDAGELEAVAEALAAPLRAAPAGVDAELLRQQLAAATSGHHRVSYRVADGGGTTVLANGGPDLARLASGQAAAAAIDADRLAIWTDGANAYRGAVLRLPNGYTAAVAIPIDFHLAYIHSFKRMIWWATGIALVIALLVTWLAVRWGHVPIRRLNARIRAINSSRLDTRLRAEEVPVELAGLVAAFNDMLERLDRGFQQLRNFSADIAHELRTPVTNLTTQTQVALSQPRGAEQYREVLYSGLEELDRMSRMIGDMLFLAQTENDPGCRNPSRIDLQKMAADLLDYFGAWAEERGVTLQVRGQVGPVQADAEMLRRALSNLVSNAIQHAPPGGGVALDLSETDGQALVRIRNPGPRIPPESLPRLFDRFYRVDPSRHREGRGVGLGLAIVKSIVELHGGRVSVSSDERETCFEVRLPLRGPANVIRPAARGR